MLSLSSRFWPKVQKTDGCWLWTAHRLPRGYGKIMDRDEGGRHRMVLAHRASWKLHYGEIPAGKKVLHRCDNPPCVRPEHLFLGTQADNVSDMDSKGRRRSPDVRGDRNPNRKLSSADVLKIRERIGNGETHSSIAHDYGLATSSVSHIGTKFTWKDV